GDFNHDGAADLVEVDSSLGNFRVLLNLTPPPPPPPAPPPVVAATQVPIPANILRSKVIQHGKSAQQTLSITNVSGHAIEAASTVLIRKLKRKVKLVSAVASAVSGAASGAASAAVAGAASGGAGAIVGSAHAVAIVPGPEPGTKQLEVNTGAGQVFSSGETIQLKLKFRTPPGKKPSYLAEVLGAEAQSGNG